MGRARGGPGCGSGLTSAGTRSVHTKRLSRLLRGAAWRGGGAWGSSFLAVSNSHGEEEACQLRRRGAGGVRRRERCEALVLERGRLNERGTGRAGTAQGLGVGGQPWRGTQGAGLFPPEVGCPHRSPPGLLLPAAHKAPGALGCELHTQAGRRGAGTEDGSPERLRFLPVGGVHRAGLGLRRIVRTQSCAGPAGSTRSSQCPLPQRGWALGSSVSEPGLHCHGILMPGDVIDQWMDLVLFLKGRGVRE